MSSSYLLEDKFHVDQMGFEKPVQEYDSCVWGIAPVAPYHIGYDFVLHTLRQLYQAGVDVSVLFPSIYLELHPRIDDVEGRINYYGRIINEHSNVDTKILSDEFQHNPDYTKQFIDIAGRMPLSRSSRALPEKNEYTIQEMALLTTQIIDPIYVCGDLFVVAGTAQRRVYSLAREVLNEEKYPVYLVELAKDIYGRKLSESSSDTRINLYDSYDEIETKLSQARKTSQELLNSIFIASVEPFTSDTVDPVVSEMAPVIHRRFKEMRDDLDAIGARNWVVR